MQWLKTGAASLNLTPLDWSGNKALIAEVIEKAKQQDIQVLCFPELCLTGYGCEDAFLSFEVQERAMDALFELLPLTGGLVCCLGLPLKDEGVIYNTEAVVVNGEIAGFTAKRFLASEGIHYEPRWFKPWPSNNVKEIKIRGGKYPIGDCFYNIEGVKIGLEICEDAWVANRPGVNLASKGVDIIFNPSASHFAFGKNEVRKRFIQEGSRAFDAIYLYANLLGNESGRIIYDGSTIIASQGKIINQGPRFSFKPYTLVSATIDLDQSRLHRTQVQNFSQDNHESDPYCVKVPFLIKFGDEEKICDGTSPFEKSPQHKEEEFTRAVSLALFDYLRKSKSKGYVVSLSGGADSSAVACLVAAMVKLVCKETGVESLCKCLNLGSLQNEDEAIKRLLTCVYQATRHSSETTLQAATELAQALNADFYKLDVEEICSAYTELIEAVVGRQLSWNEDDITLQNIQARSRAPGVWMLANIKNAILLSTSNRSEAAVGYATMDGDTCGGISPVAGIDKAFLREWLVWTENEGPLGLSPFPALSLVNRQAPTAELRPKEDHQTDEEDLMPYDVLDFIEKAAIRDKQSPAEIIKRLQVQFADEPKEKLFFWIERFFTLWCRNQWKRERYAPSFHLDDENLDPKTWCRFPILSGGYRDELQELRADIIEKRT